MKTTVKVVITLQDYIIEQGCRTFFGGGSFLIYFSKKMFDGSQDKKAFNFIIVANLIKPSQLPFMT